MIANMYSQSKGLFLDFTFENEKSRVLYMVIYDIMLVNHYFPFYKISAILLPGSEIIRMRTMICFRYSLFSRSFIQGSAD